MQFMTLRDLSALEHIMLILVLFSAIHGARCCFIACIKSPLCSRYTVSRGNHPLAA